MNTLKTVTIALLLMIGTSVSAQNKKYDYGVDSARCVENLSLFNEFIKQDAYADAHRSWTVCVNICPASRKGLYTSGEKMLRALIKDPAYASRKVALQDSLISLYDMRIANFGQEGFVLGKKANEMLRQFPDQVCEAKDVFKASIDMRKEKSSASAISNYYNTLYKCYKEGNVELETLFEEYLVLSDYINVNIEKYTADDEEDLDEKEEKNKERYISAKNNLDEFFVKFAECEDIVKIFEGRIKASPEDVDLKVKALRIMNRKECTESDLYLTVAKGVYDAQPTAESAYAIAKKEAAQKKYSTALKYMKECLDLCGDCAERTNYLKYGGYLAVAAGDMSFARNCASEMQQREPNSGHAYIIKGDATRSAAKSCDDGKLGVYGAYWVAYDYYARAKSIDSSESVQKIAGQKMGSVRGQFPATTDVFFYDKKDGDSYTSTCTGQTTTVRTR